MERGLWQGLGAGEGTRFRRGMGFMRAGFRLGAGFGSGAVVGEVVIGDGDGVWRRAC